MGYIRHHCIVVTGYEPQINEAHDKATEIFPEVSPLLGPAVNGYLSFFIPPDGSKEWWPESNEGNERREQFINYLVSDGYLDWAEVQFGDEDGDQRVLSASCMRGSDY